MYVPAHFAAGDQDQIASFVERAPPAVVEQERQGLMWLALSNRRSDA